MNPNRTLCIALDAFGSDHAPGPEVEGAIAFARRGTAKVLLVGDETRLNQAIKKQGSAVKDGHVVGLPVSIIHASETIEMEDSPSNAARRKQNSSMHKAFELAKEGQADAVVTCGNSGAAMAVGTLTLGRLPGVERPALAGVFPREGGSTLLLDLGANVECKPSQLVEFALMGGCFAHTALGIKHPRVALLSNGTEVNKGTEATREAHKLLAPGLPEPLKYVGYVEGSDLFSGNIDVAVVDGFTGNILLKTVESVGLNLFRWLKTELSNSPMALLAWALARGPMRRIVKKIDYAEVGGASLLGVNGLTIMGHGRSNAHAIQNALGLARRTVTAGGIQRFRQALEEARPEEPGATQDSIHRRVKQ